MAIDNIKIAEQLKKLQEEMNSLVEAQTRQLKNQAEVVQKIVESYQNLNPTDAISNIEATKNALDQAAEAAKKSGESAGNFENLVKNIRDSVEQQQKLGTQSSKTMKILAGFVSITGMLDGFANGLKFSYNALKIFGSGAMTVIESLGQMAIAVISFPFKILQGLIDFAGSGGDNSLRQALEDIRKEFGDLSKSSSAAIIQMSRQMKGELANTGLSVYRIFGNLAERLKTIAEYAKNIGPLFAVLAGQFVKNSEAVGAYFKGLGLTEEGQRAVSSRAMALGQDITEVTRQLANYSVQLADEFGLSAKEVSRDVGNMMNDFENFGGMAPQILTQISVYARRLGVEVKGLLGVIDQFDNFENAARSAAQLTQAFGLQLDALELLKAQDPAERTEMLRKSFFAAGRSIENMTRQERALLQQQTGLEASALDLVFAAKNQGLSYDQVKKKSESARKSQLTQEEALQKLAGAIERLVKSGDFGRGGFFERFFQGFERGIIRSHEFRKLMINLRQALRTTYYAGVQVGRLFVEHFPGVKKFFGGLADLFSPDKFKRIRDSLVNIFRDFFKALSAPGGKAAFPDLLKNLKKMFFDYFDSSTPAGRNIIEGARSFLKAFVAIAAGIIREAAKGITQGIRYITDLLSGRKSLSSLGASSDGFLGFVIQILEPLAEAISDSWPMIVEALSDLWDEVWPRVADFLADHALAISAVLFGPALLRGLLGGIGNLLTTVFTKGIIDGASKAFASRAVQNSVTSGLQSVVQSGASTKALQGATSAVGATGEVAQAAQRAPITAGTIGRMALIGLVIAVGVAAIVAGIVGLAHYIKSAQLTPQQLFTAAGVVGIAGLVMIELAAAIAIVSQAGQLIQASMEGALIGIAAVGLVGGLMVLGLIQIVDAFKDIDTSKLNTAIVAMTAGGAFIAAATGVLLAATAIGAVFLATAGTGAVAAIAGLAAIAATTELMVEQVKNVITEVGRLRVSGSFQRKFDIFGQILESVTSFGSMIADIASSTSNSSLWGWITGSGPQDQIDVLNSLKSIISDMGTEMTALVQNLIRQVSSLNAAPEELQKAELFGRIMSVLGEMVKNLQPPESLFQAESLFSTGIDERLAALGDFITRLTTSLRGVVETVVTQFSSIASNANLDENARANFEAIGSMLEVIGSLGRSLLVVINQQYSGLSGEELQQRVPQVTSVITTMLRTLFASGGGGMIDAMGDLISAMIDSLSGLSTRDAERLSRFAPVLSKAFEAVAQIGATVAGLGTMIEGISGEQRTAALGTLQNVIGTMLYGIRDIISSVVTSTRDLFSGLSAGQVNAIKAGIETVTGMIGAIASLPETLSNLVEGLGGGDFEYNAIRQRLGTMVSLFYEQDHNGSPGLPVLLREATKAFNSIPEISGNPAEKLTTLMNSLNSVTEIGNINFTEVASSIEANAEAIRAGAFTMMAENIRTMVAEVNSIAAELGSIQPVRINTQLKALAGRLGLGSSDELTIRNRDFNITVELEVHIDSEELERTLIERPTSRIMARPSRGR